MNARRRGARFTARVEQKLRLFALLDAKPRHQRKVRPRAETIAEARRYAPEQVTALQSRDGRLVPATVVAVAPAQEHSGVVLLHGLRRLHPKVQRLCAALMSGATMDEASAAAGLSFEQLNSVLPGLRRFLATRFELAA
jgi:hypothetical protein